MGFYISGAIQVHVPHIHRVEDHVSFTDEEAAARKGGQPEDQLIGQIIERTLAGNTREPASAFGVNSSRAAFLRRIVVAPVRQQRRGDCLLLSIGRLIPDQRWSRAESGPRWE